MSSIPATGRPLKDIDGFYKLEIEPWLKSHEGRRIAAIRRRWAIIGVSIVAALAVVAVRLRHPDWSQIWYAAPIVIVAISYWLASRSTSALSTEVKEFLARKLATFFGYTYEADPSDSHLSRFRDLGIVPNFDRSTLEDRWRGSIDGLEFELVEAHLEDERTDTDSKGHRTTEYETVFRGLLLRYAWPNAIKGTVILRRDLGRVLNWFREKFSSHEIVKFDDPAFEAKFEVFTDNATAARQLLDPLRRRRVIEFVADRNVMIAFQGSEVLLSIGGENLFEPGSLNHALADIGRVRSMVQDLGIIHDIPERLGLNPATDSRQ